MALVVGGYPCCIGQVALVWEVFLLNLFMNDRYALINCLVLISSVHCFALFTKAVERVQIETGQHTVLGPFPLYQTVCKWLRTLPLSRSLAAAFTYLLGVLGGGSWDAS